MRPIHPLHSILLAFPLSLFFGALVSDVAYATSFHVQWINFSSWLIAGGLFMGAFALIWSVVEWRRGGVSRLGRPMAYFLALLIMWTLGFVNALVHANDAWAHAFAARSGAPPGTQTELRRGLPALHVVRTAVLEDVDLIAFGWSGARSVARAQTVRGSVAAAPMPVLLQQRSVGELERRGLNAKRGDWLLSHAGNETHPAQRAR